LTLRRGRSPLLAQLLTLIVALGASTAAFAADEQTEDSDAVREESSSDTEFSVVPFVGGSSDVGFGGGYIASLARLRPNRKPYVYRIDTTGSLTLAGGGDGALRVPYADMFFRWKYPHVIPNRLGLELRASYTRETNLKYYGLGNASNIPAGMDRGDEFFQHTRNHPMLRATWDYRVRPFSFSWGASYTENWFKVPSGTQLANDMQSDRAYVRELLGNAREHGVPKFSFGAAWDTRDDNVAPVRGLNVEEEVALTPGTLGDAHYRFARWTNAVHVYAPLIAQRQRLVLALRVVSDLLFGNAPFYELPRFDDSFAIGGSKGVRGVPAQRYYGKIKLLANAELRSELLSLRILGTQRRLGVVVFADTGRLWADYTAQPDLDGSELGLAYGVGGGLRIASGKTFMLRFDVAWSPDAQGFSGYLLAGHMF
jgi:outer membrane protein assembly factor BamA